MEQDEKFENQLNLALDLSEEEREKSKDLDAGYDKETDQWEIIFRYAGTLDTIRWSDTTRIEPLSMGYAIAYIKEDELEAFGANEQVIYIEKPKNLLLSRQPSIAASCMLSVKNLPLSLTGEKYGEAQVKVWRRSFDVQPPALEPTDERNPALQAPYKNVDPKELPLTESLKDTIARVIPFYEENIKKDMLAGKQVLIAAHGNSLRALGKYLDNISENEITELNIPTGVPLV